MSIKVFKYLLLFIAIFPQKSFAFKNEDLKKCEPYLVQLYPYFKTERVFNVCVCKRVSEDTRSIIAKMLAEEEPVIESELSKVKADIEVEYNNCYTSLSDSGMQSACKDYMLKMGFDSNVSNCMCPGFIQNMKKGKGIEESTLNKFYEMCKDSKEDPMKKFNKYKSVYNSCKDGIKGKFQEPQVECICNSGAKLEAAGAQVDKQELIKKCILNNVN